MQIIIIPITYCFPSTRIILKFSVVFKNDYLGPICLMLGFPGIYCSNNAKDMCSFALTPQKIILTFKYQLANQSSMPCTERFSHIS